MCLYNSLSAQFLHNSDFVSATPVTHKITTATTAPTTTTKPSQACDYVWGMSNEYYINDNEISIINQGKKNTQPQSNVRPQNAGAVVPKKKNKLSGVIIDLNESITEGKMTTLISEIKVNGNIKYITIKYKSDDNDPSWKTLFGKKKIYKGKRLFTFTPKRIGMLRIAILKVKKGQKATFTVDILGCFKVHCKYSLKNTYN